MRGGDICAVALGGGGALFGDEEGGAVVDGCGGLLVMRGGCGLYAFWWFGAGLDSPIPLANMLPFTKASLNSDMLMPSSSMTSFAGLPEKSLEKRWSKSIRSCAIRLRSDW